MKLEAVGTAATETLLERLDRLASAAEGEPTTENSRGGQSDGFLHAANSRLGKGSEWTGG